MAFQDTLRACYKYTAVVLSMALFAGCRAEQVTFQFRSSKLETPRDSFLLSKIQSDSSATQKCSNTLVAKSSVADAPLVRRIATQRGEARKSLNDKRMNRLMAKYASSHSIAQKAKYRKPTDALDGLVRFLVVIGLILLVFFVIALISGSVFFSVFTGILLLLYLALMISNALGG